MVKARLGIGIGIGIGTEVDVTARKSSVILILCVRGRLADKIGVITLDVW